MPQYIHTQVFSKDYRKGSGIPVVWVGADETSNADTRRDIAMKFQAPSTVFMRPMDQHHRFMLECYAPNGSLYDECGDGYLAAARVALAHAAIYQQSSIELVPARGGSPVKAMRQQDKTQLQMQPPAIRVTGDALPVRLKDAFAALLGLDADISCHYVGRSDRYYGLVIEGPCAEQYLRQLDMNPEFNNQLRRLLLQDVLYSDVFAELPAPDGLHVAAINTETMKVTVRSFLHPKGIEREVLCGAGNVLLAPMIAKKLGQSSYNVHTLNPLLGQLRLSVEEGGAVTLEADTEVIQEMAQAAPLDVATDQLLDRDKIMQVLKELKQEVIEPFQQVLHESGGLPDMTLLMPDDAALRTRVHPVNHLFEQLVSVTELGLTSQESEMILAHLRDERLFSDLFHGYPAVRERFAHMLDWVQQVALSGEKAMEYHFSRRLQEHLKQQAAPAMQISAPRWQIRRFSTMLCAIGFPYDTYPDLARSTQQVMASSLQRAGFVNPLPLYRAESPYMLAFTGGGPLPLEAWYLHLFSGTDIVVLNDDAEAAREAAQATEALENAGILQRRGAVRIYHRGALPDHGLSVLRSHSKMFLGTVSTYFDQHRQQTAYITQAAGGAILALRNASSGPMQLLYPSLTEAVIQSWVGEGASFAHTAPPHMAGLAQQLSQSSLNHWVYNNYTTVLLGDGPARQRSDQSRSYH